MGLTERQTIESRLRNFIDAEISIPQTARTSASTSQSYLRNVLRNKELSDQLFPNLLRNADQDFVGGSFGRHTKIWPLDDIDLFVPLDGATLIYTNQGSRLPYTLRSDGITSNRLSTNTYTTGGYINSHLVLTYFLSTLRETYPSSELNIDEHCVNIQTQVQATSESDGIGFDVVPCLRLRPDMGGRDFYLVPDGVGGWMRSDPRLDNELCEELHTHHNKHFRKVVRLIKYWNKTRLNGAFSSYYLELALIKEFEALRADSKVVIGILGGLVRGFGALSQAFGQGNQISLIAEAKPVIAPTLSREQADLLALAERNAMNAFNATENQNSVSLAGAYLNTLFETESFS